VYNTILSLDVQVLDMKIRELAEAAHVSTTVVLNFCKKLDCAGWTAFKIKYKESLQAAKIGDVSSAQTPIMDFLNIYQKDEDKKNLLNLAVDLLTNASRVIFIGAGPSGVLAKYGSLYLSNIGKTTHYIDTPYYPIAQEDYTNAVVIALSVSGETTSVVQRLIRFKELGAKLVAITNTQENTMSKMSDVCLSYYVIQEEFYISEKTEQFHVNMTTQIPVIYLIEEITHQLMNKQSV